MADRLIAKRGFNYPVGASLERVRRAGGLPNLSEEERASLVIKRVEVGGDCSDMPPESVALYESRGQIVRVRAAKPKDED